MRTMLGLLEPQQFAHVSGIKGTPGILEYTCKELRTMPSNGSYIAVCNHSQHNRHLQLTINNGQLGVAKTVHKILSIFKATPPTRLNSNNNGRIQGIVTHGPNSIRRRTLLAHFLLQGFHLKRNLNRCNRFEAVNRTCTYQRICEPGPRIP